MPELNILERLTQDKPIVADGATGTNLHAAGLAGGEPPERWVMEKPEAIHALHQSFIDVGSELILSCTFGATRTRLKLAELDDHIIEINRRAVVLAREAAGAQAYTAGDIGPLGELLAPLGTITYEEAVDIFAEQAAALVDARPDLIYIETMTDLNEMKAAIEGARRASGDIPIFATMSFDAGTRTSMGVGPEQAAEALLEAGVAALGANCGKSLADNVAAAAAMREAAPRAILIAKPNAGLPRLEADGETVFDTTPAQMAASAREFLALGVKVIGGCCGTSPAHIQAIAAVVNEG